MAIQKDSGEILLLIYNKYTNHKERYLKIRVTEILNETGLEELRLDRAIDYLKQKKLIETFYGGVHDMIVSLSAEGIDVVEDKNKFKKTFNFALKQPYVEFDWKDK
jgi:hypothetical protein